MRGFLIFFLSVGIASAQLSVQIRASKDTFLVYESIPVTVRIHNFSGRTIQLNNTGANSWLKFSVIDERNQNVLATAPFIAGESVLIPAGQTVSRSIDLLPYYELRDRGNFRVQASVTADGVVTTSSSLSLTIINGREVWTQTVGLPDLDAAHEEYRIYTLVARREADKDQLYLGVRGEPSRAVFSLIPLGPYLLNNDVKAQVDKQAHVHVLFQNGPRSFGYVHVDPSAKILSRAAFSDYLSSPELKVTNTTIMVMGGEQTYPRPERILTDDELNPPPPPPPPKPKKKSHWWWPFGAKHEPGTDQ